MIVKATCPKCRGRHDVVAGLASPLTYHVRGHAIDDRGLRVPADIVVTCPGGFTVREVP